ncbi:MAG: DNA primase, partial [Gammaproteobacteria bacterium]|nr:DNA primase [Gammaproteobacteria bacterium]
QRRAAAAPKPAMRTTVRLALSMLLHEPRLAQEVENPRELEGLQLPGIPLLIRLLEVLKEQPHIGTAAVLERWRDSDEGRHLSRLLQIDPPAGTQADIEQEFRDTLQHLLERRRRQRAEYLEEKLRRKEPLNQEEKTEWQQMIMQRPGTG